MRFIDSIKAKDGNSREKYGISSIQRLKNVLQNTNINKEDLAGEIEINSNLPNSFIVFIDKFWEIADGKTLIVKYLSYIQQNTKFSNKEKEKIFTIIECLIENLIPFNETHINDEFYKSGSEHTQELLQKQLVLLKTKNNTNEFKIFLSKEGNISKIDSRTVLFLLEQDIQIIELDKWYSRIRARLLMGGNFVGAKWLDIKVIKYLKDNGIGIKVS